MKSSKKYKGYIRIYFYKKQDCNKKRLTIREHHLPLSVYTYILTYIHTYKVICMGLAQIVYQHVQYTFMDIPIKQIYRHAYMYMISFVILNILGGKYHIKR